MKKPDLMRLQRTKSLPEGEHWHYELKFDGYRALLVWDGESFSLLSKNGKRLNDLFPDILHTCNERMKNEKPFQIDGELIIYENKGRADFYHLQRRHRLRKKDTIAEEAQALPACFLAFDCLQKNGKGLKDKPWYVRKKELHSLLNTCSLPLSPAPHAKERIQFLSDESSLRVLEEQQKLFRSEGIIAKKRESPYEKGRSSYWYKKKTPSRVTCFVTAYDPANDYVHLGVYDEEESIKEIGKCAHGFSKQEKEALVHTVKQNGSWRKHEKIYVMEPSIVIQVQYTTRTGEELREPRFQQFLLQTPVHQCTYLHLQLADLQIPDVVKITHPDKPLWSEIGIEKHDFLRYVRVMAPYVLPWLKDRPLTVIRYPHGMADKGFFQKDCPDYAPDFVETVSMDDQNYIVCNQVETLLWLANQLAIEWHIPFQRYHTDYVDDIVIDLDPPNPNFFHLAIEGALLLKELCDQLEIISFIKFSGNKGLQLYIPLPEETYSWEETEVVTELFGEFLLQKRPDMMTRERMKNKRGNKMYIDIPQHRKGKTIIAPYSVRGKEEALVACPLFWGEVTPSLDRKAFTMDHVIERLKKKGCPFEDMERVRKEQDLSPVLHLTKS